MFSPKNSTPAPVRKNPVPLDCLVAKPEHQGFGRSKHTTFLIKTNFGQTQKALVRRRFTDFVWLQERLVQERAGIIVPVMPPPPAPVVTASGEATSTIITKVDKFSDEFVAHRQARLNRLLSRIINHDELKTADCLWTFFTANPKDWAAAKKSTVNSKELTRQASQQSEESVDAADNIMIDVASATSSSNNNSKKKGWGQWMKETRTKFALSRGKLQLEETPAQAKTFGDMEAYANHMETCTQILHQDCQGFLLAQMESSHKLQTMAAAFSELWGEHSLQNTSTSDMYQKLGETWATASKQVVDRSNESRVSFQEPLEELTLEVVALKEALEVRKSAVKDYTKHYHHNQWLMQEMEKLKRPGTVLTGAKEDAYYQLEADISASDKEVKLSKQEVDLISDRLEGDVPRFRRDFHERMQKVLRDFHQAQSQFLMQTHGPTWSSILPRLEESLADAPSQPQLAPVRQAATLDVSFSTAGAQVSVADPNSTILQAAAPGATTTTTTTMTNGSMMMPMAPAPMAAPPPPTLHAVQEPTMDDGDMSFDSMNLLGAATAPPPGAAPPALPPPPVPASASNDSADK
mmetsp:Transcript_7339/g.21523  ORF Transcript_7339/g.21523 Transcript_7339/m.21523 type:complete len:578 (-) Transcript_7339:24-1757(-)